MISIFKFTLSFIVTAALIISIGCAPKGGTFSVLPTEQNFKQNKTNPKIDVLFVIDNSGSMATSQKALADNIPRFFEKFDAKSFDYQIAVTTTDAYRVQFGSPSSKAKYRDGTDQSSHSGVFIVKPTTPNRQAVFVTNVLQGIYGSGDERAFQSMQAAIDNSENAAMGFPRYDAYLAIIILSDSDDLSSTSASTIDTGTPDMYNNQSIIPVANYLSYLDQKMGAGQADRNSKYNVHAIGVFDDACLTQVNSSEKKIAQRYGQLVEATGGIKGSLCDDFGTTLSTISANIVEMRTQFFLEREPNPATLVITVDGTRVPELTMSSPTPWNGFIYHADTNSVTFHGSYVPASESTISVQFDPLTIK